jgi:hypothetical protein
MISGNAGTWSHLDPEFNNVVKVILSLRRLLHLSKEIQSLVQSVKIKSVFLRTYHQSLSNHLSILKNNIMNSKFRTNITIPFTLVL